MPIVLTEEQDEIFVFLARKVREGFFEGKPRGGRAAAEFVVYRATTLQEHAPGETWPVQLNDSAWGMITGETPDAENPSPVTIPTGTRLLLCPGTAEAYLILQAFICADPP